MTNDNEHPEPTRADLVAFCQEVWRLVNEHEEKHGRAPNEYQLTRISKSHDTTEPLWVIDFLYTYDLAGLRRTVYGYYILTQEPRSGKLWFVRWDEMEEEKPPISYEEIQTEIQELRQEEEKQAE